MQFFSIKLHCAIVKACFSKLFCQGVEHNEQVGIFAFVVFCISFRCWLARSINHSVVFENGLHLFIGVSSIAFNHGMHHTMVLYVRQLVHFKDYAICQFLFIRTQRAYKVAQTFGQHWYGSVYQINGSSSLLRLLVDDRAFFYIVRHVCNVHTHLPIAIGKLHDRERIVEVFGVFRVDGAGKHLTEILTLTNLFGCNLSRDAFCSLLNCLGILIR